MNSKGPRVISCLSLEENCWVLSSWESWDIKHALRTPCWLLAFSCMRLLRGHWPKIISHVQSISVCDLSLVIWPLQSILFNPSTFCWQRHRHICPHTSLESCVWRKEAPNLQEKGGGSGKYKGKPSLEQKFFFPSFGKTPRTEKRN